MDCNITLVQVKLESITCILYDTNQHNAEATLKIRTVNISEMLLNPYENTRSHKEVSALRIIRFIHI
jgi:hypothetical protein